MAVLNIIKFPDPLLRKKSQVVKEITPPLVKFAEDMMETMWAKGGVGLAAIQVSRPLRLLTADTRSEFTEQTDPEARYDSSQLKKTLAEKIPQPLTLFNPEIKKKEGQVIFREGCLSFPSYYAEVKRAEIVEISALDKTGQKVSIRTDGLLSICLQHEIDHLNGRLFIDHLSPIKAQRLREEIKKQGWPEEEKPKKI